MKTFSIRDPFLFGTPAFLIAILVQRWPIWLVAIMEQYRALRGDVWMG